MKKYNTPVCDIVTVATEEIMADMMSLRIFNLDPEVAYNENWIITDGSEILTNSKLWDENEDSWK